MSSPLRQQLDDQIEDVSFKLSMVEYHLEHDNPVQAYLSLQEATSEFDDLRDYLETDADSDAQEAADDG